MDSHGLQFKVHNIFLLILLYSIIFLAEFHEEIQTAIPSIVKCLEDSHFYVRRAALDGLLNIVLHGMYYFFIIAAVFNYVFSQVL